MKHLAARHKDQHFALNSHNQVIHIKDAKPEQEQYFCLSCGELMIPKRGNVRSWHYAHKNNSPHCSYETYLHSLSKRKICEYLQDANSIKVSIKEPYQCQNRANCRWTKDENVCRWYDYQTFDLKHYYNKCMEERSYNGYRADVLLFNEQDKYPPIFIEIHVSHPCSQEKIDSGIKIIEIDITDETDLTNILKNDILEENDHIKFYNFKRYENDGIPTHQKNISKFILLENNKMFCSTVGCLTYQEHHHRAKMEVCIEEQEIGMWTGVDVTMYEYGSAWATTEFPEIRTCNLCKYHVDRSSDIYDYDIMDDIRQKPILCKLYKKLGTQKYCSAVAAEKCSYYKKLDKERLYEIVHMIPNSYTWQNKNHN